MSFTLSLHGAIHEIPAAEWDACGGADNPFVSHAFLTCLEESGSTGARAGWLARHAVLRDAEQRLVACAPLYVKSHSYGEYVFDWGWARAMEQAGGEYYPKLQVASPFSPVPGPRLMMHPDSALPPRLLADALVQACQQMRLSSVHITFCTEAEYAALGEAGWLQRLGVQYHFENPGYADFDAFLAALNARKRKNLKRERRDAQSSGLEMLTLRGPEVSAREWDAFYGFYENTIDRKWGSPYLTKQFFKLLGDRLGDRVVLMLARENGAPVAGALNVMGKDTLYGRNWGALREYPFLHFELCYYRAIDFALAHSLKRVEAGAQGEHKIQRGYLPAPTYSAHWIADRGLRRAVAAFLDQERPARIEEMAALAALSPFRQAE